MILSLERESPPLGIFSIWRLMPDIVDKSGAWYAYEGNKIGQGRENTKQYLKEHTEMLQEIEQKVRAHYGLQDAKDDSNKD